MRRERKGKTFRKTLGILLSAVMLVSGITFMPGSAIEVQAATTKDVNLGTGGIGNPTSTGSDATAWAGSKVYYAGKECYVLDKDGKLTGGKSSVDGNMLLLTQDVLSVKQMFDDDKSDWTASDCSIRNNLNSTTLLEADKGFLGTMTSVEQNRITALSISSSNTTNGGHTAYPSTTTTDKIFLLDLTDVNNANYGFDTQATRAVSSWWWLRSPGGRDYYAAGVLYGGYVDSDGFGVYSEYGSVRPAFNLNLSSVLFSSASGTSKSTFATVKSDKVKGNVWKLTLTDSDDTSFEATLPTTGTKGQSVTVTTTTTGNGSVTYNQTSAILADSAGTVVAYGKIGETGTGDKTFTIPSTLSAGNYTLHVFEEQVNSEDENLTDYASKEITGAITISEPTPISSVAITGIDTPEVGSSLDTDSACATTGVATTAPTVTWTPSATNAGYNTAYTASVTLEATAGYAFTSATTANVNGVSAKSVAKNDNGTLTVTYTFGAIKDKLTSITQPNNMTVANGTAYNAMNLPTTVGIVTVGGTVTTANVLWNTTTPSSGSYDPSILTEQNVTLTGTVTCPDGIDQNSVALTTTINVKISAAGIVGTPTFNPVAGTYTENQSVTLSSSTEDATIYYTTNGDAPTTDSTEYSVPISVTGVAGESTVTTIKAIAVKSGMQTSSVASAEYTIQIPASTYPVTVNSGTTASSAYEENATVTITANAAPTDKEFDKWTVVSGGVTLASATSSTTTFTMPANAVEVTATFKDASVPEPTKYAVTVNSGTTASSTYAADATVTITANAALTGKEFDKWTVVSGGVTLASATSSTTTFTMPANAVEVTATYKDKETTTPPTTPDEPQIGDKTGWDEIKDDVVDKVKDATATSEKITITIDMNGTTQIQGDVIDAIKGKNVDLVIDLGNGIKWTINGNTVTSNDVANIDLGVNVGSSSIPVDVINSITGQKSTIQISLVHNGEFGFTATLSIGLEASNAGYYANLFYYNQSTGKLEFMNAAKIDTLGNAVLTFTHASDYSIVIADKVMDGSEDKPSENQPTNTPTDDKTDTPSAPQTGDNSPILLWILVLLASGFGIGAVASKESKRRKKQA